MKTSEGTSFSMNIVDLKQEENGITRLVLQSEPRRPKIDITLGDAHTKKMIDEGRSTGDKVMVMIKRIED
jgi:hypothetical protein